MKYSQSNEQDFVLSYFEDQKGVFLDIGANDGQTLSNSFALVENNWVGVCVEASPKAFDRLLKLHGLQSGNGIQLINVAVGSYDGEIELNESGELLGMGDVSLVSSTRHDEMDRWASINMPYDKVTVPCVTFKTLLERSLYPYFDFLTIDIEGMEPEVVPQINFTELGVKMAIIEWNGKNAELYDGLLSDHGLNLIHTNFENRIYCR
jgi:FkbM family methyltransferase